MASAKSQHDGQIRITLLPDDLKTRINQFVDPNDALSFAATCKNLNGSLSLSCLRSTTFVEYVAWSGGYVDGDTPRKYQRIPILFPRRIHSVGLSLRWEDQGWGNRKGQIYVVAVATREKIATTTTTTLAETQTPESSLPQDRFNGGRLVYESPIAKHNDEPLRMSFCPKADETYYLWYKVGGGGGHELKLQNIRVHMLVQMDVGRNLCRNFSALHRHGILDPLFCRQRRPHPDLTISGHRQEVNVFSLKLLSQVAQSLRTQLEHNHPVDEGLSQFLKTYGITTTTGSLTAVIEIATATLTDILLHIEQGGNSDEDEIITVYHDDFSGENEEEVEDRSFVGVDDDDDISSRQS